MANVNDAPTGSVTISGTATQGETLTASNTLADADGLGPISYQWQANGSNISGAIGDTLVLGEAQVGKTVTVVASYTDGHGTAETRTSSPTAAVANVNDAPTGSVAISGTPTQGETLTASNTLADADGLGPISYQWQANGSNISGAIGDTLVLGEAQVGKTVTVVASYTDGHGTAETRTSSPTAAVANVNDTPTGAPMVTGTATERQTLNADTSSIRDADGLGTFAYQWLRDGSAVTGATASTYLLGNTDVDARISVQVSYTDAHGTFESLTSASTSPVANVNDTPTGAPVVTGTATERQTLTADTSSIADGDGLGTFAYQWLRDGTAVTGATASTYLLGNADVNARMSVWVSYTDAHGTPESLTSAPTSPVANVNDTPTGAPVVTGTATERQTLNADTSSIRDADGLGTFAYQWLRDGTAVTGATASSYLLGNADVAAGMSVRVTYTDAHGTPESLTSASTSPVTNVNDAPTGAPLVTGTATERQTLTADTSLIADADGLGTFAYQWLRDGTAVTGATASTYLLGNADVDARMSVQVSYTDAHGTFESLTSAATSPVANVNDTPTGAPVVTGTATERQTLTADTSSIRDADGLGTFAYQWLRDGNVVTGATASTYLLGNADVDAQMSVQVAYTDAHGTFESLTSAADLAGGQRQRHAHRRAGGHRHRHRAPDAHRRHLVDRRCRRPRHLRLPVAARRQRRRRCHRQHLPARQCRRRRPHERAGDLHRRPRHVREPDQRGDRRRWPTSTTRPPARRQIGGTATERQTLTADTSSIADADGLGTFAYQWLRDGSAVAGATASTLPARQCRRRRPHQRAGGLHRRPRHVREPDQRSDLAGGQRQRHAHRRAGGHRHRHRAPDAHRRHLVDRRCRRPGYLRLPVAARRQRRHRCHRQQLPARQCRRRRPHQRAGGLHRRPRHAREPDQRGDRRRWSTSTTRPPAHRRSPAPPPSARRSPPTPRRSPTPTAWVPSPTSGCATVRPSPAPPPVPTCSATPTSTPASACRSRTPTPTARSRA